MKDPGSLHGSKEIEGIVYSFMYLFHDCPDIPVTVPGQEHEDGSAKLGGKDQDGIGTYVFHAAPETAYQSPGRDQFIPVIERSSAAKEHDTYKEIMFFHGEQGSFLGKRMKYAVPKLLYRMEHRMDSPAGRFAVFLREKGNIIQLFCIHIAAVRFKKATGRKACEIFLAGLQLICPQNAHGLVSPVKGAGIGLPQH